MKCKYCGEDIIKYKSKVINGELVFGCKSCMDENYPEQNLFPYDMVSRTFSFGGKTIKVTPAHVRDIKLRRRMPDGSLVKKASAGKHCLDFGDL